MLFLDILISFLRDKTYAGIRNSYRTPPQMGYLIAVGIALHDLPKVLPLRSLFS